MARSSTTFTKQTAPKGKGSAKNNKTKLKEALGLSGFERVGEYLTGDEIADKVIKTIGSLNGKNLLNAIEMYLEYFKPKLSRTELSGKDGKDLIPAEITHNVNFK